MPKTTAREVANWLVWFANEHGDPMTNLRMQKLLYYAQAWHLALHDAELFDDDFQAWIHGPVISFIYGDYKKFGCGPIVLPMASEETLSEPQIDADVRKHLMDVMESYGECTAWHLEQLTHTERPWIEARGGLPMDAPCKNIISRETMRKFYKELYDEQASTPTETASSLTARKKN